MIVLIRCWVSSAIMIPSTKEENFRNRGSVGSVLRHGSIEYCANPLFGIKHHNDSQIKRGEVPTLCKCGEVSMPWKHRRL